MIFGLLIGFALGAFVFYSPGKPQAFVKSKVIPSSYVAKTLRAPKWRP